MAAMRRELNGLPIIPGIWLDGRYLAAPSEYPQVRAIWQEYLNRIQEARASEVEHYSDAYLSALDDARVTGSTRTLRLASAVSAFRASAPQRAGYYTRVEELAAAALHLHDQLAAVEDSISYEPAVGPAVSADPVIEAAGSNPATQQLLDAALDHVAEALYAGGLGPVEASRVPTWVLEGLREAVTGP
jgi:hypothetical protein